MQDTLSTGAVIAMTLAGIGIIMFVVLSVASVGRLFVSTAADTAESMIGNAIEQELLSLNAVIKPIPITHILMIAEKGEEFLEGRIISVNQIKLRIPGQTFPQDATTNFGALVPYTRDVPLYGYNIIGLGTLKLMLDKTVYAYVGEDFETGGYELLITAAN